MLKAVGAGVLERDLALFIKDSVGRSLDSADIAADHNGDEPAADKFLADEGNVCSLYHGICCFNGAYQTFGFDHTECFILSHVDFLLNFAFYF